MNDGKRDPHRRVIHAHCSVHGGPSGFTNLVCAKRNGDVELDPRVSGGCVIVLDEKAAHHDPPVDVTLPPQTPAGRRLSCPTASLLATGRFPHRRP